MRLVAGVPRASRARAARRDRSSSGSSAARPRIRSSSTSPSRTSPRIAPSQPSSSRSVGRPFGVEERPERAQIRAQASRRDSRLVHPLGIGVEAHDGVVLDQADDGDGDRAAHDVAGRRARRERRRRGTSGDGAARGPSARMYFGVGSGAPAPAARRRSTSASSRPGGVSSAISTSSSRKLRGDAPTVEHRDLVVDDVGEQPAVGVARARRAVGPSSAESAARARPCGRSARTRSTACGGRSPPLPANVSSPRTRSAPSPSGRELDRPAFAEPVAEARAPAGEPKVVGVEYVVESRSCSRGDGVDAVGEPVEAGSRNDGDAASLTSRSATASESSAPSERAGLGELLEAVVGIDADRRRHLRPAVAPELPGEHVVSEVDGEDLVEACGQRRVSTRARRTRRAGRGCAA